MTHTPSLRLILAALGSLLLLVAAFAFQYLGGLQPCIMCLWQRWPHAGAALLLLPLLALPRAAFWLGCLGTILLALATGLALMHVGVEQNLITGPGCGLDLSGSPADLMNRIETGPPPPDCTDIAWSLFGLSMAAWNAVLSAGLFLLWLQATIALRPALATDTQP